MLNYDSKIDAHAETQTDYIKVEETNESVAHLGLVCLMCPIAGAEF